MGIDNFYKWLKEIHGECFVKSNSDVVYDGIYIDVNHILHNALYGSKKEEQFVKNIYNKLDIIFSNFIATKKIVMAMDGPSPYSKILLQRKRRRMGPPDNTPPGPLNPLHLTPGTEMMAKIGKYIQDYAVNLKKAYKYLNNLEIIVSTCDEPDEGEIKICKEIANNTDINSKHLIIGNDADLVVLAMGLSPKTNINLLVRTNDTQEIISIPRLLKLLQVQLNKNQNPCDQINISDLRNDFIILSIMNGNDYLPKISYITFETIWDAYKKTMKLHNDTLIKDNKFNLPIWRKFFRILIQTIPKQYRSVILSKLQLDCVPEYLTGLIWCMNMYQTGKCSQYDYMYSHKVSPNPIDICYYLEFNKDMVITVPKSNVSPIPINIYTLLIVPKKAKGLIPKQYQHLLDTELKYLYEEEECKECHKLKAAISDCYKQFKARDKEDPTSLAPIKDLLAHLKIKTVKHKKKHTNDFGIKDIQKIIAYAK